MRVAAMHAILFAVGLLHAASASGQALQATQDLQQQHDDEVRAKNAETDYFFVSSVMDGLKQIRFYIDRNTVLNVDGAGYGRAWVDSYQVIEAKRPLRIQHRKALIEVRCGAIPQSRFTTIVTYAPDGSAKSSTANEPYDDVVPGTSQQTLHRFVCHDEPANALYPVFNGNTPVRDATTYFSKQAQ